MNEKNNLLTGSVLTLTLALLGGGLVFADSPLDEVNITVRAQLHESAFGGGGDRVYNGYAGLKSSTPDGGEPGGGIIDPLSPWIIEDDVLNQQIVGYVALMRGDDISSYDWQDPESYRNYNLIMQDAIDLDDAFIQENNYGSPINVYGGVTTFAGLEHSNITAINTLIATSLIDDRGLENITDISVLIGDWLDGVDLSFPSLERIGTSSNPGNVQFGSAKNLTLDFPALKEVNSELHLEYMENVVANFPELETNGYIFMNNASNVSAEFPKLETASGVYFENTENIDVYFGEDLNLNSENLFFRNSVDSNVVFDGDFMSSGIYYDRNENSSITINGDSENNYLSLNDNIHSSAVFAGSIYVGDYGAYIQYNQNSTVRFEGIGTEFTETSYISGTYTSDSTFSGITSVNDIYISGGASDYNYTFDNLETAVRIDTNGSNVHSINFPSLTHVSGDINTFGNSPTELNFPSLETVSGMINLNSDSIETLNLPSLVSADQIILSLPNSTNLNLNALESANELILQNLNNIDLSFESLTEINNSAIVAYGLGNNLTVSFPVLTEINSSDFSFSGGSATLNLPVLTTVSDELYISDSINLNAPNITSYNGNNGSVTYAPGGEDTYYRYVFTVN